MKVVVTFNVTDRKKGTVGAVRIVRGSIPATPPDVDSNVPILAWDVTFPDPEVEKRLRKYFMTKQEVGGPEIGVQRHVPMEGTSHFTSALCTLFANTGIDLLWDTQKVEVQEEEG